MTRLRMRAALVAALVACVGLAVPATAAPSAPATAPAALAGTTTIVGDRSASMLVRVPRTAFIDNPLGVAREAQSFTTAGPGLSGFALVSTAPKGPVYVGAPAPPGTDLNYVVMRIIGPKEEGHTVVIAAGEYRLYLVTGHKSSKLTLKLRGLSGSASLAPKLPTQGVFETPAPDLDGTANKTAYTAGATTYVEGEDSIQLAIALARHQIHTESVHLLCASDGQHSTPGPHCPSPKTLPYASVVSFETIDGLTHGMLTAILYNGGGPRERTTGYSMLTTTPAEVVGYLNLWVSLEDPDE